MGRTIVISLLILGSLVEFMLRLSVVVLTVISILGLAIVVVGMSADMDEAIEFLTPALLEPLRSQLQQWPQHNDSMTRRQRRQLIFQQAQHEQAMRQLEERAAQLDKINQTHAELGLPPIQDPNISG